VSRFEVSFHPLLAYRMNNRYTSNGFRRGSHPLIIRCPWRCLNKISIRDSERSIFMPSIYLRLRPLRSLVTSFSTGPRNEPISIIYKYYARYYRTRRMSNAATSDSQRAINDCISINI